MARVGLAAGMGNVGSDLMDLVRGREPVDWVSSALTVPLLMLLFGLGGLLYTAILSRVTRAGVLPTRGVRVLAGTGAGTAVGALFALSALFFREPATGAMLIALGAILGLLSGFCTPNQPLAGDQTPAS